MKNSSLFFSAPLTVLFLLGSFSVASAEEMVACTDCTLEQEAVTLASAEIANTENDIQTLKTKIRNSLLGIKENSSSLDAEFEQMLSDLIANAGCTSSEEEILSVDGIQGYLYDIPFSCANNESLEALVQNGFQGNMIEWSTTFDSDNTNAWTDISNDFVQLEQSLDDYFAMLIEYEQKLSDAQGCVEFMLEKQSNGECTEENIDHEEEDVPADFEEPVDCPECSQYSNKIENLDAQLLAIEQEVEAKNGTINTLDGQLMENTQFSTNLADLFENVGCNTTQSFEDIEVSSGQVAGVIYGQTYYCQDEASTESLISALETFWETHTPPSTDEDIINQISTLLGEIETLQDEYNALIAEKVSVQELQQNCTNLLLTLHDQGMCLAEDMTGENDTAGDDDTTTEEVKTGETIIIPAEKRRSGSGGSRKIADFCDFSLFSNISPAPNTMVKQIEHLSFDAIATIKPTTIQLTVAGEALELKATKKTDGSYAVVADLPKAITKNGKYRVELYGENNSSPICARDRLFTLEVNTSIGTSIVDNPQTPENESEESPQEGDLFSEVTFLDIKNHWAKEFILQLAQRGIIEGYGDGTFGPDNNITRAELTKIALEAFAIGKLDVQDNPFPDVDSTQWYSPFIAQAKLFHIVSGYSDSMFRPNISVTRGEGLKILLNAAGIDTSSYAEMKSSFSDVEMGAFSTEFINWSTEHGIVSGYGNGTFGPNDTLTRGQLAKIVMNLLNFLNR
ncbi:S-layer homology domain-containing protein [Candidatus Peregrinibacteria bacterium]|nr:MAG: S-layer homology domain-containing protein [Candidatus Peregrinibacteria bacterium]